MKVTKQSSDFVLGLDVGDKTSSFCSMTKDRRVTNRGFVATDRKKMRNFFESLKPCRVVLEAGTHSNWIARLAREVGHQTVVANPRRMKALTESNNKSDRVDAFLLARFGISEEDLLHAIQHHPMDAQVALSLMRSRDQLVTTRTALVSHVRGSVKVVGERLQNCSTDCFETKIAWQIPKSMRHGLIPILRTIQTINQRIKELDVRIAQLSKRKYPQTELLRQVNGIGPLNALAMVLTIGDPTRFKNSRQVGRYFGLVPKKRQSGNSNPQLGITKEGSAFSRHLAVTAAQYVLGRYGADSDLRRYGLRIIERNGGSKYAKKKAVVAVARKLAVLCHHLLLRGDVYDPFHGSGRMGEACSPAA